MQFFQFQNISKSFKKHYYKHSFNYANMNFSIWRGSVWLILTSKRRFVNSKIKEWYKIYVIISANFLYFSVYLKKESLFWKMYWSNMAFILAKFTKNKLSFEKLKLIPIQRNWYIRTYEKYEMKYEIKVSYLLYISLSFIATETSHSSALVYYICNFLKK